MKAIMALLMVLFTLQSVAQEISGRITNEQKEPVTGVTVYAYQGTLLKDSSITGPDGSYSIKLPVKGYYDIQVQYDGYYSMRATRLAATEDQSTMMSFVMKRIADDNNMIYPGR